MPGSDDNPTASPPPSTHPSSPGPTSASSRPPAGPEGSEQAQANGSSHESDAVTLIAGGPGALTAPPAGPSAGNPDGRLGQVLAERYRIDSVIASGGMGTVYLGEHVRMRKRVAIKLIAPSSEKDDNRIARFEREAIAGAHVHHPNVAGATDFGQLPDGTHYLVLEYVPGITLYDVIQAGPVQAERAVRIARQVAEALGALHAAGIVHRDLKPRNIMVVAAENNLAKVIDFGLANMEMDRLPPPAPGAEPPKPPRQFLTAAGMVLGTVAYMAPETALGMRAVDARADFYALGVLLYEMLAGKHPFESKNPVELFLHHKSVAPPPFALRAPEVSVPAELAAVIFKLLEKDPAARYQTAADVIAALDMALLSAASSLGAKRASTIPPASSRSGSRTPPPLGHLEPETLGERLQLWGERLRTLAEAVSERAQPTAQRLMTEKWVLGGIKVPKAAALGVGVFAFVLIVILAARPRPSHGTSAGRDATTGTTEGTTAAPTAEQANSIQNEIDHMDADAHRTRLLGVVKSRDWNGGATALLALADLDQGVLRDRALRVPARDVAAGVGALGGETADKVFDALTNRLGPDGLDVLYEVMRWRAGTKGATRAGEILKQEEVVARESAALRLLMDMHAVGCAKKRDFFQRAADEGDERALLELQILHDADCPRRKDPCCYKNSHALDVAMHALRTRMRDAGPAPVAGGSAAPLAAEAQASARDGGT